MRAFLTGGTGFIGSHVAEALLCAGHEVVCHVRPSATRWRVAHLADGLRWFVGSLEDGPRLAEALAGCDAVLHIAAYGVQYRDQDWRTAIDTNVRTTAGVMIEARNVGIRRIVVAGSCVEYGKRADLNGERPLREDDLLCPTTLYAATKSSTTLVAQAIARQLNMEVIVLRPFHTYGPREDPEKFVPSIIRQCLSGRPVKMTAGQQVRDYCYVADVAEAFAAALEGPSVQAGEPAVVNIGSGRPSRLIEVARMIQELVPETDRLEAGALPYRPDEVWYLVPDLARAHALLGWCARTPLKEGLRQTVAWYRSAATR